MSGPARLVVLLVKILLQKRFSRLPRIARVPAFSGGPSPRSETLS